MIDTSPAMDLKDQARRSPDAAAPRADTEMSPAVAEETVARLERVKSLPPPLAHALTSPLRVQLVAHLLGQDRAAPLTELVLATGRPAHDVRACLQALVTMGTISLGASGYRLGPGLPAKVREGLERVVSAAAEQLGRERTLRHQLLAGLVGPDPRMHVVRELVDLAARIGGGVLIVGEAGAGRKRIARAVHDAGPRRNGFFGAVECGEIAGTLVEAQLFGLARGGGADHVGLVERCHEGTLLLADVGELGAPAQLRLARLTREGMFSRVDEDDVARRSEVRVIATAGVDLWDQVRHGSFREDLLGALGTLIVHVPTLRDRLSDLPHLCASILKANAQRLGSRAPAVTEEALLRLGRYHWPGNVDELESVLVRAAMMAAPGPIGAEHLTEVALLSDRAGDTLQPSADESGRHLGLRSLAQVERDHIQSVLRAYRGNVRAAADTLGISRTTLYKKLRDYGLEATP
jgi:DNA-binding NtrC family response regulator